MARTAGTVTKDVARDIEVLPDDKRLNSAEFESLERVLDTVAVLPGVLADLIEVLLNEPLLLDELDVREGLGGELDSLRQ